jgi:hypothetical protein
MRWPWVGREADAAVCSERDYLRTELSRATDHERRMERRAAGLPEAPKAEREVINVPDDLKADRWANPSIGKRSEAQAVAAFKILRDWDRVRERLQPGEPDADA